MASFLPCWCAPCQRAAIRWWRATGAELIADTCVDEACCWGYLAGKPGVTDSPKGAYYMETAGVKMAVRDVNTCIRWAQNGRVC